MLRLFRPRTLIACSVLVAAGALGCADQSTPKPVDVAIDRTAELAKFRDEAGAATEPAALVGGASSRDALIREFVAALASSDTVAFRRLMVSGGEFAWFYYPGHPLVAPPYNMPPALLWMQIVQRSNKGLFRALERFSGDGLTLERWSCADAPKFRYGASTVWERCTLHLRGGRAPAEPLQLFGEIIERDGRVKFVDYTNPF
jgi:hypothetical protein